MTNDHLLAFFLIIFSNVPFPIHARFSLFVSFRMRMHLHAHSSLFLPWNTFFALPSICFLSFSLFFFYHKMEPEKRTLLCKTIFNPFWRPFSPLFFKSFAPHSASHPHSFHFDFTALSFFSLDLSFSLVLIGLSLPLWTISSNPVSSKLCRILVRR